MPTPFARAALANRSVTSGSIVLMSMMTHAGCAFASTPSAPAMTFSTTAESGSMVMTMSLARVTSATLDATLAPERR